MWLTIMTRPTARQAVNTIQTEEALSLRVLEDGITKHLNTVH